MEISMSNSRNISGANNANPMIMTAPLTNIGQMDNMTQAATMPGSVIMPMVNAPQVTGTSQMGSTPQTAGTSQMGSMPQTAGTSQMGSMPQMCYIPQMGNMMEMCNMMNMNTVQHLSLGMQAPDFSANTTFGPMKMSGYKGKWLVFFSHPGDFTPVCTTEFLAFSQAAPRFNEINTQLLGLSIDSNPSHLAWVYAIYLATGVQVPFPVVADRTGEIARLYGMIAPNASTQETVRNVFIIDPDQKIRAILIYPLTNGRNIQEIIRLVEALQMTDKNKVVTPANWQPGQPVMVPAPQTYNALLERENNPPNLECEDWFWCYKELPN